MLAMNFNRGRSHLVDRVVSEPYQKCPVRHENSMNLPLIIERNPRANPFSQALPDRLTRQTGCFVPDGTGGKLVGGAEQR
jgi:hypothetical protein